MNLSLIYSQWREKFFFSPKPVSIKVQNKFANWKMFENK